MIIFQEMIDKAMEELGYADKVQKLRKTLLDFGFVEDSDVDYCSGIALKLPDNPLNVHMDVLIDYRGFVEGKYYTNEYNISLFRFLLYTDSPKYIFQEIVGYIQKMLRS